MTTAQGEAFATMLAVFGKMEAAAIRARVKAARDLLLRTGRYVGGGLPYGWRGCREPGRRWASCSRRTRSCIDYVREMVRGRWLGCRSTRPCSGSTRSAPHAGSQGRRKRTGGRTRPWSARSRHPVLAGMTPYNPGNATKRPRRRTCCPRRGRAAPRGRVGRDHAGGPVAGDAGEVRRAERAAQPGAAARNSGVLSGLMFCGDPPRRAGPHVARHGRVRHRPAPGLHLHGVLPDDLERRGAVVDHFLASRATCAPERRGGSRKRRLRRAPGGDGPARGVGARDGRSDAGAGRRDRRRDDPAQGDPGAGEARACPGRLRAGGRGGAHLPARTGKQRPPTRSVARSSATPSTASWSGAASRAAGPTRRSWPAASSSGCLPGRSPSRRRRNWRPQGWSRPTGAPRPACRGYLGSGLSG